MLIVPRFRYLYAPINPAATNPVIPVSEGANHRLVSIVHAADCLLLLADCAKQLIKARRCANKIIQVNTNYVNLVLPKMKLEFR